MDSKFIRNKKEPLYLFCDICEEYADDQLKIQSYVRLKNQNDFVFGPLAHIKCYMLCVHQFVIFSSI